MSRTRSILEIIKWTAVGLSSSVLAKFDKEKGRNFLLESFRGMPGLPAKFAQIVEMRWDKDVRSTEFEGKPLQGQSSDSPQNLFTIEDVKLTIQAEVPRLFSEIEEIESQGKSASLGQVHWAKMKSGENVAIKVQYPNLDAVMPVQLDSMLYLMEKSPAKNFGLNVKGYKEWMSEFIGRELDYCLEAKVQQRFGEAFSGIPGLAVPKVYWQWSSRKVLTQEYLSADGFADLLHLTEGVRESIARTIVEFWLTGVFEKHLIHTDLQPRNWGYSEELAKVVLYDYGSWMEISETHSLILEEIISGVRDRRDISPLDYLVALGFDGAKLLPLLNRLPVLLERLLDPFLSPGQWEASRWNLSDQLAEILHDEAWWFRTAGAPWFLWFMRSAQGLFAALDALMVKVPFQAIYFDVLSKLEHNRWKKLTVPSQTALLHTHQLNEVHFKHEANQLCIKVTEDHTDIVSLQFPVHVVQELELLMSEEVRIKIESQGYRLQEIKAKIIKEGLLKSIVLDFQIDRRRYLLWLQ